MDEKRYRMEVALTPPNLPAQAVKCAIEAMVDMSSGEFLASDVRDTIIFAGKIAVSFPDREESKPIPQILAGDVITSDMLCRSQKEVVSEARKELFGATASLSRKMRMPVHGLPPDRTKNKLPGMSSRTCAQRRIIGSRVL